VSSARIRAKVDEPPIRIEGQRPTPGARARRPAPARMAVERAIHPIHAGSRRAATAARVSHNAQPGRSGARHRKSHGQ
jgi:hypothetical protein